MILRDFGHVIEVFLPCFFEKIPPDPKKSKFYAEFLRQKNSKIPAALKNSKNNDSEIFLEIFARLEAIQNLLQTAHFTALQERGEIHFATNSALEIAGKKLQKNEKYYLRFEIFDDRMSVICAFCSAVSEKILKIDEILVEDQMIFDSFLAKTELNFIKKSRDPKNTGSF